jgi:hypothetical protein
MQRTRLQGAFSVLMEQALSLGGAAAGAVQRAADDLARVGARYGGLLWNGLIYDRGI